MLFNAQGAGKTSLYFALLGGAGRILSSSDGGVLPDMDLREGVANGINYVDAAGVNLQACLLAFSSLPFHGFAKG